jgi:5'-nucleotidase
LTTVLLTNDDGVQAAGIAAMRETLTAAGMAVIVVAPDRNHSAGAHRVTAHGPLQLRRDASASTPTFSCSGTPADCVRVGVLSDLFPAVDVVVAGINEGANAGEDIHYSGTVAAAAEGAMMGLPAIAVSQDGPEPELPFMPEQSPARFIHTDYTARLVQWMATAGLPSGVLLNVNFPLDSTAEYAQLSQVGRRYWSAGAMNYVQAGVDTYTVDPWAVQPAIDRDPEGDYAKLVAGIPTINVLSSRGGLHDILQNGLELDSLPLFLSNETESTHRALYAR